MKTENVDLITQRFIEPLNDKTRQLFKPINFRTNDRCHIELNDTGKHFILDFFAVSFEGRRLSASWSVRKFVERIPERKPLHKQNDYGFPTLWQVAGTDFTALLINAVWTNEQLSFSPEAKLLYEFLLTRFLKQTINSQIKAAYKLNGEIPEMPDDFIDHPNKPLMSFQKVALFTQIFEEGSNLWMEQGTGKTPIIIARTCYEANRVYNDQNRMYRALIGVPKNMRVNWRNKFVEFAVQPGKLTILRGGQLERVKLMVEAFKSDEDSKYTVVICSYETILRSWDALRMIEWDLCALDESHMIKGHYTKRWNKMKELRELVKARTGLTGTPLANNLFDAWTQLEWLGEGLSGFTTYKAFKKYYGRFVRHDNSPHDVLTGYQNLPLLQERFARLCFMITRKEAMPELPEKTYDIFEIEMTPFQRECYMKLQSQLALEIENELSKTENKQLTASHILTKLLRLSQITAGYLKWDAQFDDDGNLLNAESQFEEITPNPKIEALVELIKNKPIEEKTIIWTNWVAVIKMLHKRFEEEGIKHVLYYGGTSDDDRQAAQDTYNMDSAVRVFIGNPAAGGVGLDLWGHIPEWADTEKDHGCNTTQSIYYSQGWSMIHRSQSEDRPVRRGTRVSVQVTDLIVPGTIDEEIATRVLNKQISALQLQDVRVIMERILTSIPSIGDDNV